MKQKFSISLSIVIILSMLTASAALADTVVNNIDTTIDSASETVTIASGGSTTVGFYIHPEKDIPAGDPAGCGSPSSSPATATLDIPVGVNASTSSLTFPGCDVVQNVVFTSSNPGTYNISISEVTGGKVGALWETSTATFMLIVTSSGDTTPPVISYVLNPASPDGEDGWYKSDVTLTWTVNEPDSPSSLVKTGCDDQNIIADQAAKTYSCSATSTGGSAGPVSVTIKRDATPPVFTASLTPDTPASTGWYNSSTGAPKVSFSCSDSTSGLAGNCPDSHTFGEGAGQSYSQTISDVAGNSATAGVSGIKVDLTAPVINLVIPANGASYWLNEAIKADYSCSDSGSSGLKTCDGTVPSGNNIDTASVGLKEFTVDASDVAGNTSSAANTYTVSYKVCVLFDQSKAHKAGSTVPLKLQLCDVNGTNYSSSSIVVQATSLGKIDSTASPAVEDSGNANPDSNFRYDPSLGGSGGYIFNLSTKGLTTGTWKVTFIAGGLSTLVYSVTFDVR